MGGKDEVYFEMRDDTPGTPPQHGYRNINIYRGVRVSAVWDVIILSIVKNVLVDDEMYGRRRDLVDGWMQV